MNIMRTPKKVDSRYLSSQSRGHVYYDAGYWHYNFVYGGGVNQHFDARTVTELQKNYRLWQISRQGT